MQPAVIADNICRGQVGAVIHLKQHFFLVIGGCRSEHLLAKYLKPQSEFIVKSYCNCGFSVLKYIFVLNYD